MPKLVRPGPIDPYLRALAHGVDGTEPKEELLNLLTLIVPRERVKQHRAELAQALAEWGVRRRILAIALWKIVQRVDQARSDTEATRSLKERARWKKSVTAERFIGRIRSLEEMGRFDDKLWEHARPLRQRLEELRQHPTRWIEPLNWHEGSLKRRRAGNPLTQLVRWARSVLADDAGVKDSERQTELLRHIGLVAPKIQAQGSSSGPHSPRGIISGK
jgi:hypothetical protein